MESRMKSHPRRQQGLTLIEVIVALAIGVIALVGIARALTSYTDGLANQAAAAHAKTVSDAARAYIADNHAALVAAAGPSTAATVTPAQLTAGKYLPTGFNPVNPYGQTFTVKVIEPTAGKLEAVVLTTGGDVIKGQNLRKIAQHIGVPGGYVEAAGTSASAKGAYGTWTRSLAPFEGSAQAGKIVVALFVEDAAEQDDYLHRSATAGRPELNRMSTDIDMGAKNLDNAGTVYANAVQGKLTHTGGYFTLDSYSSTYGTGAGLLWWNGGTGTLTVRNATTGGNGNLILNDINAYKIKSSTVNAVTMGATNVGLTGTLTAANVKAQESYADGWFRSTGTGGWYNMKYQGGWYMSDPDWIRSQNNKGIYTSGQFYGGTLRAGTDVTVGRDINATRNVSANGVVSDFDVNAGRNINVGNRLTAGEFLLPQGVAACNATCPTNGLIGRTTAGQTMACISGTWRCLAFSSDGGGDPPGGNQYGCLPDYPPTGCPAGYSPILHGCKKNTAPYTQMRCP